MDGGAEQVKQVAEDSAARAQLDQRQPDAAEIAFVGLGQRTQLTLRRRLRHLARVQRRHIHLVVTAFEPHNIRAVFKKCLELVVAVVGLIEGRVEGDHTLLELTRKDGQFVLLLERAQRAQEQGMGLADVKLLGQVQRAHQCLVEHELVHALDEDFAGRTPQPDTQGVLAVLAQLTDQRRVVRIAGDDDVGLNVRVGEQRLDGLDAQADVSAILVRHSVAVQLHQVDRIFQ